MVKVVDAIMGAGKSSAAIAYMNEHLDKKFIYITPYLDEASRITRECPNLHFREPRRSGEFCGSKTLHTLELVRQGQNVATTHNAFKLYTHELLDLIHEQKYTLIIDENVDVLEKLDAAPSDVSVLIDSGRISEKSPGVYGVSQEQDYGDGYYSGLLRIMQSRDVVRVPTAVGEETAFYWRFPESMIRSFEDVIILTYMFRSQSMRFFLDMCHIPYVYIGVLQQGNEFRFADREFGFPEYVTHIRDRIHILDNPRLNKIGDKRTALSLSWFQKNPDGVKQLKNNLYNYFYNIVPADRNHRMWGSYAMAEYKLRGKGYARGFVVFNEKATNKYRERTTLAYCANVFMNVEDKMFYKNAGVEVDDDEYALSVMVQWIWRSAIRDGKDINIYIPSRRMRDLLINWMDQLSKQGASTPERNTFVA